MDALEEAKRAQESFLGILQSCIRSTEQRQAYLEPQVRRLPGDPAWMEWQLCEVDLAAMKRTWLVFTGDDYPY